MHRAPLHYPILCTVLSLTLVSCSQSSPPPTSDQASVPQAAATASYVPKPVYCADGSDSLCAQIPSFIGADPALKFDGYQGLSHNVTSPANDAQTPFDNMSWQMFVALNWQAAQAGGDPRSGLSGAGTALWQTYARPEDVFGGPSGLCPNPKNLPRFNIIAKSGAQGSRDEEFIQATGQPLIDVRGNWTLFERRLNPTEREYIEGHGLNTYAGQQAFVQAGKPVQFPPGDHTRPDGKPGAIEMKAAWRIIESSEASDYFSTQALIDVQGAYVRDGQPLCAEVTLGLVGLHIIQANAAQDDLLAQFIWASFEHKSNAPLAAKACDPVDNNCYQTISNNNCPAAAGSGDFSYSRNHCSAVTTNNPPVLGDQDSAFIWERQAPYAASYLTSSSGGACEGDPAQCCGTQVARCWSVYDLTQKLNGDWQQKLAAIDSVFANYYLIGTNWGGSVEPEPGKFHNNSVPAFLGNSTMETFVQANADVGSCVTCHAKAKLAAPASGALASANFSFLLGLATEQNCSDADAGPIFGQEQADTICPRVCSAVEASWNGQWTTTQWGVASVCGCCS